MGRRMSILLPGRTVYGQVEDEDYLGAFKNTGELRGYWNGIIVEGPRD